MNNKAVKNEIVTDDIDESQKDLSVSKLSCEQPGFMNIIGQSKEIQKVFRVIKKVAESDSTIIIYGESGTGKELVARAIHCCSDRRNQTLVPINCGAIPDNLLESELFGHVRGAFTGATTAKTGKFEIASEGTTFLDEIGDMSSDLQVKILRVLEEREFNRVGGSKTIKTDTRILAATHRNLEEAVQKGTFREDLFYRLEVIPIHLPTLRQRKDDIPLLVSYFLDFFNKRKNKNISGVSDGAMKIILEYLWPGNIRELKNMLERIVVLKGDGEITPEDLPNRLSNRSNNKTGDMIFPDLEITEDGIHLNTAVNEFERALIYRSLEKSKWVKNRAAKLLHLNRTTLVEKIKRYRLTEDSPQITMPFSTNTA